jgi:hypothetical protein
MLEFNSEKYEMKKEAAKHNGKEVPLGKIMKGDVKKFKVYVKDPKSGNVKKVNFGHGGSSAKAKGEKTLSIKRDQPSNQKSFLARHHCETAKDRTTPRYWSCKAWRRGTKLP